MGIAASQIAKASKVDRACERLEAAISRLESAIESRPRLVTSNDDVDTDDLTVLRRENDQLRECNRDTAAKLDGAIGKLERLLAASGD